ncbi:MAG: flagellar basal body-associated FliL family protein [Pseudomonadota bacterium]
MKLFITALMGLAIFGGGYVYQIEPAQAGKANAASKGGGEVKKGKDAKDEYDVGKGVSFVRLDPLILPIIDGDGVSQVVSLVIVLEAEDQFVAAEVRRLSPRLKDAYIQNMYGMLNRKASLEGGVLKVAEIKERLNKITQKVMGDNQVNDVLLEVVQQRPI